MKLDYEKCLKLLEEDTDQAKQLISDSELDLNQQENNCNILFICVAKGLKEIIEILLQKGLPIDIQHPMTQATALHAAASNTEDEADERVAEYLFSKGAKQLKDRLGALPLHYAAQRFWCQDMALFLEHGGGNTEAKDNWDETPMHWVMYAIPNLKQMDAEERENVLHRLSHLLNSELTKTFFTNGKRNNTPFDIALMMTSVEVLLLILGYVLKQEGREEEAEKLIDRIIQLRGAEVLQFMEKVWRDIGTELKIDKILHLNYSHVLTFSKRLWHPADIHRHFDEILKLDRNLVLSFLRHVGNDAEAEQVIEGLLVLKCHDILCLLAEFASVSFFQKIIHKYHLRVIDYKGDELVDKSGCTLVHFAARNYGVQMLQFLRLEMRCSLNATDKKGRAPLYEVIRARNFPALDWFVSRNEVDFLDLGSAHYCSVEQKEFTLEAINRYFKSHYSEKGLDWAMKRFQNFPQVKAELIKILKVEIEKYSLKGHAENVCRFLKASLTVDMSEGVKLAFQYLSRSLTSQWKVMVQRTIINKKDSTADQKNMAREEIFKLLVPGNLQGPNTRVELTAVVSELPKPQI